MRAVLTLKDEGGFISYTLFSDAAKAVAPEGHETPAQALLLELQQLLILRTASASGRKSFPPVSMTEDDFDNDVNYAANRFLSLAFELKQETTIEVIDEAMICAAVAFIASGSGHKKAAAMLRREALRLDPAN